MTKPSSARTDKPAPAVDGLSPEPQTLKITTEAVEKIVGIGSRQMRSLRRSKGCPIPDGGIRTIDELAAVVRWRADQAVADARREADAMVEAMGGMTVEMVESKRAQVGLKLDELKLGEKKGLLLPKKLYVHVLSMMLAEVASLLRAQGSQLGPLVSIESDARVCQEIIDSANDAMLAKLTVGAALDLERLERKEDERFVEEAADVDGTA